MKKRLCVFICMICSLVPCAARAETDAKIFFAPQSMNAENEIIVPVYAENLPKDTDGLCGLEFDFTFNAEQFSIKSDSEGKPLIGTTSTMLVQKTEPVTVSADGAFVSVSYVNFSGKDTVMRDGPLFYLTFIPKSPDALWNSDDYYPLRFVPESVNLITFNADENSLTGTAAEGIDTYIGGYNTYPSFETPEIKTEIELKIGGKEASINGELKENDAPPYIKNEPMLPIRIIAENIGANLDWNGDSKTVSFFIPYTSVYMNIENNTIYINAKRRDDLRKPEITDGRTFVPLSTVREIFGEQLNIENNDTEVSLHFK